MFFHHLYTQALKPLIFDENRLAVTKEVAFHIDAGTIYWNNSLDRLS